MENILTNFNYSKLEFDKILLQISKNALSSASRQIIIDTIPFIDILKIKNLHKLISQFKNFCIQEEKLNINVIYNFKKQLDDSRINIAVQALDLYQLSYSIKIYFFISKKFKNPEYPDLGNLFSVEKLKSNFYLDVLKYIDEKGFIDSKISAELKHIRQEISSTLNKIKNATESFFKEAKKFDYTVDDIISIRDGFSCIAIKSSYKNKMEGMILDSSSTGQTVFIVPKKVIELNNDLFILKEDEKKEIQRILAGFTDLVFENINELEIIDNELINFDIIYSKTKYALEFDLNSPEIIEEKNIILYSGKHPLLGEKAVPLDIDLGKNFNILVITGPNTGGKTVVLKTIGLFVLMVQSGIPIPASSSSKFSIFDKIFIDIGDEQSIESSLSTFSSHLVKIIDIIKNANEKSLLLLDELCAGTDPNEGSSLAISVIEKLLQMKSIGIITTHYSAIKHFAAQRQGIENASMEFDPEKLAPTYKLKIGIPGSSKAFEISKRLGMPDDIVENAKSNVNQEFLNIELLKEKIDKEQREIEIEKESLLKEISDINKIKNELSDREEKLLNKENDLKNSMQQKENQFLKESRREFEEIVKRIKNENAAKETIKSGKELFNKIESHLKNNKIETRQKVNTKKIFKKGDEVFIVSKNSKAFIISKSNKADEYLVQAGLIKLNIDSNDLELVENKKNKYSKVPSYKIPDIKIQKTLDLRGTRYDEAERKLEKFVEEAIVNSVTSIRIIHGIGTGAIRKCMQEYFDRSSYIKEYDYEKGANENSTNFGVTVAILKYY